MMIIMKHTLLLTLTACFSLYSMDAPCFLADLPEEIHNHIASYLTFHKRESDDEFVARTKKPNKILPAHQILLDKYESNNFLPNMDEGNSSAGTIRAYSIDRSKIISLKKSANPTVTILSLITATIHEHKKLGALSQENINNISHIAFSYDGTYYAQLQIIDGTPEDNVKWQHWVLVKHLLSDEIEKFLIPGYYDKFTAIGFNKQGTKIIVHFQENNMWDDCISKDSQPETWHHIIPLTSEEEHKTKSTKTFATYLLEHWCCKDLTQSLTQS